MIPPKYTKAVEVSNLTDIDVIIKVTYGNDELVQTLNKELIKKEKLIVPNETVLFNEEIYDLGSYQVTAPVQCVNTYRSDKLLSHYSVQDADKNNKSGESIVQVRHLDIIDDNHGIVLIKEHVK